MSETRKFRVRSRLSMLAFGGGGINVRTALLNAERVIEAMKPPSLEDLDRTLGEIQARFGAGVRGREAERLEALYDLASRIIEASFALPDSGVEPAARSLCDLTDACMLLGVKDWAAIDVHIDGLVLLRAHGQSLPAAAKAQVLGGLAKVASRRVSEQIAVQGEPEAAP